MTVSFSIGETVQLKVDATTDDGTPVDLTDYNVVVSLKIPNVDDAFTVDGDDVSLSDDGLTLTANYVPSVPGQHFFRFEITDGSGTTIKGSFFQVEASPFD